MADFSGYVLVGGYERAVIFFMSFSLSFIFMLHNTEYWLLFPGTFYDWIFKYQI